MGCGKGNDVTYPNKASFGASSVSKLALFEYVTSFPLPHPIKILTMLHQVVTRSFLLWAPGLANAHLQFVQKECNYFYYSRSSGPVPNLQNWNGGCNRFTIIIIQLFLLPFEQHGVLPVSVSWPCGLSCNSWSHTNHGLPRKLE